MTQTTRPDKRLTREYLERRTHEKSPPPPPEDIRRELGWHLIPANGQAPEVPD